jgi:hypothetical protein
MRFAEHAEASRPNCKVQPSFCYQAFDTNELKQISAHLAKRTRGLSSSQASPLVDTSPPPFTTLPPELLLSIFTHLAAIPGTFQRRFAFTYVCRRWRTLALQTSSLWTYLFIDHTPGMVHWNTVMLSRSGEALLHVEFKLRRGHQSLILQVLAQVHRFRSLCVDGLVWDDEEWDPIVLGRVLAEAPHLENLDYRLGHYRNFFPLRTVISAAQSLRKLSLCGVPDQLQVEALPELPQLSVLSINWDNSDGGVHSCCSLLLLLRKVCNLRDLTISEYHRTRRLRMATGGWMNYGEYALPSQEPLPAYDSIILPVLRTLKILGRFDFAEELLDRLQFPLGLRLSITDHEIHVLYGRIVPKEVGRVHYLQEVMQRVSHPLHRADLRLGLNHIHHIAWHFTAWNEYDYLDDSAIKLELHDNDRLANERPVLAPQIFMSSQLKTLQQLKIRWTRFALFDVSVFDVLGTLPHLHTIEVYGTGVVLFIDLFVRLVSNTGGETSFPALLNLSLAPLELSKAEGGNGIDVMDLLMDALTTRPNQRLDKLHLGLLRAGVRPTPWLERMTQLVGALDVADASVQ